MSYEIRKVAVLGAGVMGQGIAAHLANAGIPVPTLLLWGDSDNVVPTWVGERLEQDLPDARLVVLRDCGHLPPEEKPDESFEALTAFLDETDRQRSRSRPIV